MSYCFYINTPSAFGHSPRWGRTPLQRGRNRAAESRNGGIFCFLLCPLLFKEGSPACAAIALRRGGPERSDGWGG